MLSICGYYTKIRSNKPSRSLACDVIIRKQSLKGLDAISITSKIDKRRVLQVGVAHSLDNFFKSPRVYQITAGGIREYIEPHRHNDPLRIVSNIESASAFILFVFSIFNFVEGFPRVSSHQLLDDSV